jgi:methyl-accepting chemotaxis protein
MDKFQLLNKDVIGMLLPLWVKLQKKIFDESIRSKFARMMIAILIISIGSLSTFNYFQARNMLVQNIKNDLTSLSVSYGKSVGNWLSARTGEMEVLAASSLIVDAGGERSVILPQLVAVSRQKPIYLMLFYSDIQGDYFTSQDKGSNISDRPYFSQVLQTGKTVVSEPVISKSTGETIIVIAAPVKKAGKVTGLIAGTIRVQEIQKMLDKIKLCPSGYAYMTKADGLIVIHPDKEKVMKYNPLDDPKADPVLKATIQEMLEGKSGFARYRLDGVDKFVAYAPITGVGVNWSLAVTGPVGEILKPVRGLPLIYLVATLLVIGITVMLIRVVTYPIITPLQISRTHLEKLATGDFSSTLPPSLLKKEDEVGVMARSMHIMQQSVRRMLKSTIEEFEAIRRSVSQVYQMVYDLLQQVDDTSATVEQMSAGIQESSSIAAEMNNSVQTIESGVSFMAGKARESADGVRKISDSAANMSDSARDSEQNASRIYHEAKRKLMLALEQSKTIEKIDELANVIILITDQTNLLSLNAQIEAARAGDSGRGFAVVADEIGKLAEDSKQAVAEIQKITQTVLAAFNNLIASAKWVADFIDAEVIQDYKELVKVGDNYTLEAKSVDNLSADLSHTAAELEESVRDVATAIGEMATTINQGAFGTQIIAGKANAVVEKAKAINEEMKKTDSSINRLKELVEKFRIGNEI